jgi:hypothetical protein
MDPQFYGDLELDAGPPLNYADQARHATGVHFTMTHLAGRAAADGLTAVPDLRVRLARGREYARESVDVFFVDGFLPPPAFPITYSENSSTAAMEAARAPAGPGWTARRPGT